MQRHALCVAACFSAALMFAGAPDVWAQGAAAKDKVRIDFNTSVMVPGMTLRLDANALCTSRPTSQRAPDYLSV